MRGIKGHFILEGAVAIRWAAKTGLDSFPCILSALEKVFFRDKHAKPTFKSGTLFSGATLVRHVAV